jgi:hypothetical protein
MTTDSVTSYVTEVKVTCGLSRNTSQMRVGMMQVLCGGCGKALPVRSGMAGRPATYHGATCRQRARRARLAAEPDRAALLAGLEDVGHALSTARRAVLTDHDAHAALKQLRAAVTALAPGAAPQPQPQPQPVTKPVTESADRHATVNPDQPRPVTPADQIDPDTVQVQRCPDFQYSGRYYTLATARSETVLLGILKRSFPTGWVAMTPWLVTLSGGPWRTRQDALVQLLLRHDLARTNARRRTRHTT